jgi:hypothetical protein
MAHLRLDNMLMPAAKRLTFKSPVESLAGTVSGDTIYGLVKHERGKCLVLSVDLDRSDLTFRTAFPIMVTNALNWFRGNTGELQSAVATGGTASFPLVDKTLNPSAKLVLKAPDGSESEIRKPTEADVRVPQKVAEAKQGDAGAHAMSGNVAADSALQLGPFDRCGIWKVVARSGPEPEAVVGEIAVNLANEHESDLRPNEASTTTATTVLAGSWFARPLWYYLAACALFLSVAEWLLHQRRLIT